MFPNYILELRNTKSHLLQVYLRPFDQGRSCHWKSCLLNCNCLKGVVLYLVLQYQWSKVARPEHRSDGWGSHQTPIWTGTYHKQRQRGKSGSRPCKENCKYDRSMSCAYLIYFDLWNCCIVNVIKLRYEFPPVTLS